MTLFQMKVQAIREVYPKHTPNALSLAQRPTETGVCLIPAAQEIADRIEGVIRPQKRTSENRVKSVRFAARLTPAAADAVKHEMAACGISSVQTLVEMLLLEWVKKPHRGLAHPDAAQEGVRHDNNNPQAECNTAPC